MKRRERGKAVTKNGMAINLSLDPMTLDRLAYSVAVIEGMTKTSATNSTIVRRAVEHYVRFLEDLIDGLEEFDYEELKIRRCNEGQESYWKGGKIPIKEIEGPDGFEKWKDLAVTERTERYCNQIKNDGADLPLEVASEFFDFCDERGIDFSEESKQKLKEGAKMIEKGLLRKGKNETRLLN